MVIEPISELKNYNSLLTEVKDGNPIFLTKNGKGLYAIMTIDDANDYEKYKINKQFECDLKPNVADMDFFVKDIESLNKKLKEAYEESIRENDDENEDMKTFLNRLREDIRAGKI